MANAAKATVMVAAMAAVVVAVANAATAHRPKAVHPVKVRVARKAVQRVASKAAQKYVKAVKAATNCAMAKPDPHAASVLNVASALQVNAHPGKTAAAKPVASAAKPQQS